MYFVAITRAMDKLVIFGNKYWISAMEDREKMSKAEAEDAGLKIPKEKKKKSSN